MQINDDIISLLREESAQAAKKAQRGVILQPGAIGDCILTLPLAAFMKEALGLGGLDIFGHTEYIGILPGRTCVDSISSIDAMDLYRLFVEPKEFDLTDRDPLINVFAGYAWIATFLGEPNSSFEQNLIFTANCSHSSEVITLPMKAPRGYRGHLSEFYKQQFMAQTGLALPVQRGGPQDRLIRTSTADKERGRKLLAETGVGGGAKLVVIHPGSGGPRKCWHVDNFLSVAEQLISKGLDVMFLLGPAELERFERATIRRMKGIARCLTDLSLTEVLELLSCADAFVSNDGGITHLAGGLGIRTFAVFGPTDPAVYRPLGPSVTVLASSSRTFARKPSARLQESLVELLLQGC